MAACSLAGFPKSVLAGLLALLALAGLASWGRQHEQRRRETARMLDKVFEARARQANDRDRSLTSGFQSSTFSN